MQYEEILDWLKENDPEKLETLWKRADAVRRENVGDAVYLRGLIELSNICRRQCLYCGIRAGNSSVERYRLTTEEVLGCAKLAQKLGYGTLVIQAGEDLGIAADWIADLIHRIKSDYGLAITLSLGERNDADWILWREAGADRYLLRFETSNVSLFNAIHPPQRAPSAASNLKSPKWRRTRRNLGVNHPRLELLRRLREIGYEVGSGVMAGIPGQSWEDLARDIELFGTMELDMIGCGPYLPHPQTPLGDPEADFGQLGIEKVIPKSQVSVDESLPFKVIALARLVSPAANIPSTTAVATLDPKQGRLLGLSRGANIVMPNLTPTKYRKMYEIYPNKAASFESPEQTHRTAVEHILSLGRTIGVGPGASPRFLQRTNRIE